MKWIVGTGRCGLHNYTKLEGGYIHSDTYWREQVVKKYHGDKFDKKFVDNMIKVRREMKVPCITDCSQFMFIDRIKQLDKGASFVWIVRDKNNCVKSLLKRVGEDKRIHPKGWNFHPNNKKKLIEWYYDEVNKVIGESLKNLKFEKINTEDMKQVVFL